MAKDPAFLFYYQDFLVGIDHMTLEQVGAYIKCLCHQASRGTLRASHMLSLVGSQENLNVVAEKFSIDENGELFNERLRFEMEKRKKFTQSRLDNLHKATHKASHMEAHMENENEIDNENLKRTTNTTKPTLISSNFDVIWSLYPKRVGKKEAFKYFKASVKTEKDYDDIHNALINYKASERVMNGYIFNGSTWFNNWPDWVDYKETACHKCKGKGKFISSTGYEVICDCPRGKNP